MNRREFIKGAAASVGAWSLGSCGLLRSGVVGRLPKEKPNIVLIMADDIGFECFGCYGGTSYRTPVINGLARSGVRFTHCYSQPLCTPSRVKLMTGKSNIRNYTHFGILDPGERTFAHMLRDAGYRTAVTGKWQLYGAEHYKELAGTGTDATRAGFDEYCLWQLDKLGSRYWDPLINQNGEELQGMEGKYGPDVFCDFALDFMERNRREPFFLYYPMALVHNPFFATPESADLESVDKQRNFADMVAYMDLIVGRIVKSLEALGLRENTILMFTGDNGTNPEILSEWNGRMVKGGKARMTDGGTHVPFVVHWPGCAPKGLVCDDLVDFSDFLPTLAEAAGAALPEGELLDGRSFLPQVLGLPGNPREWIFCYHYPRPEKENSKEELFARDKRWKLYGDGKLFDLERDPLEERAVEAGGETVESSRARARLQEVIDRFMGGA